MSVFKCKMCGGDVELTADKTLGTCEYCGCTMTFPKVDDDQRAAAFNRGNHFRRTGEFDKALSVYERIVNEDDNDAEAHWCCALCRFGIEYVEDPATYEWLPTMHRLSYDSFLEDVDYLAAVEHSNGITQRQYQKDAMKIAEVQKGILATSQNEEPFDVFICYKESDENGDRTVDSSLAQDIYYQLTDKGYKVFFSRITLEDKVGTEYEPYIFAALNSAKVMLVIGTKPEYLNAVWVKNEWSRFIAMMKKDRKRVLLPCYRGMDPYDMPEALSVLQSYDMAKIGFIQDLIRGIEKIVAIDEPKATVKETVVVQQGNNTNIAPLIKRAYMFLEDEEWDVANEYAEKVLDNDPECAEAYLCKLLIEFKCSSIDDIFNLNVNIVNSNNFKKAKRFANGDTISKVSDIEAKYNKIISDTKQRIEEVNLIIADNDNEINRQNEEIKSYVVPPSDLVNNFAALDEEREKVEQLLEAKSSLKKDISVLECDIRGVGIFGGAKKKEMSSKIELNLKQIREIENSLSNLKSMEEIDEDYFQLKRAVEKYQNEQKNAFVIPRREKIYEMEQKQEELKNELEVLNKKLTELTS